MLPLKATSVSSVILGHPAKQYLNEVPGKKFTLFKTSILEVEVP